VWQIKILSTIQPSYKQLLMGHSPRSEISMQNLGQNKLAKRLSHPPKVIFSHPIQVDDSFAEMMLEEK
jgi:hypothetical protein